MIRKPPPRPRSPRKSAMPAGPDFSIEQGFFRAGKQIIAGVDEAGRGPWAGPVVAAAVVLDQANIPEGLNDSKKLSAVRREKLFTQINKAKAAVGIAVIEAQAIDEINILQATLLAMATAIARLPQRPDIALIDGNQAPRLDAAIETRTLKKGDARSLSIAAASIIAKVTRDEIMCNADKLYPGYDFARHKGYGTKHHVEALDRLGVCPIHRKSFAPVEARLARE